MVYPHSQYPDKHVRGGNTRHGHVCSNQRDRAGSTPESRTSWYRLGIGSLPAIFISLISGVVGDKVGPKRVLIVSSLLGGLLGAARGLTNDFSLIVVVILLGTLIPFVAINNIKTVGQWFPPHQLGLANGLISMGMALGFCLVHCSVPRPFPRCWAAGVM